MTTPNTDSTLREEPTIDEILESHSKWWKDRADQLSTAFGFYGRDLRIQDDLLKTVMDMEQDISFLLKENRSILMALIALQKEEL